MFIWETHKKMPSDLHDRLVSAIGDDSSHYINYDGANIFRTFSSLNSFLRKDY